MRLHRFIGGFDLSSPNIQITDPDLINQAARVLRLKTGDQMILADGLSNEATVQITNITKNLLQVQVLEKHRNQNEPDRKVYLYCAILKRENFELVIQKATEAGVHEIVPIITERTVKTGLNMERLRKIIKEAAEQSGRGLVPRLHQAMDFKKVLEHAELNDLNILFDPEGNESAIRGDKIGIFIGPEGGFSDSEIKFAKENNFQIGSLGKLTLRAETAAIVASYLATQ